MSSTQQKIEFFKLGFFLGLITGTIAYFTMQGVPGVDFYSAFGIAVLAFLIGMVVGCGITLFLSAFRRKQAGR